MPLRNPFRRETKTPTVALSERHADLKADLARVSRKPEAAARPEPAVATIEGLAEIEFEAYALDAPVKSPKEWGESFGTHAAALHIADRSLRMTKPELMDFVRRASEREAASPAIMLQGLDEAQQTLEGWSQLLDVARTRYMVAVSAGELAAAGESGAAPAMEAASPAAPLPSDEASNAPADLADACRWALQRRLCLDAAGSQMSDEEADAADRPVEAVFIRAIDEPSASLREIVAKAALALEDYERFIVYPGSGRTDSNARIVHAVLREVAALSGEAITPVPCSTALQDRDLVGESASYVRSLDLSSISFGNLVRLFEVCRRTHDLLGEALQEPQFWSKRSETAGGTILDAESNRLGMISDACAHELAGREPESETERDDALAIQATHQLATEGRIMPGLLAEIREAWGGA